MKYSLSALARIRKMVKMVIPLTQGAKTHYMCMKSTSMKRVG